MQSISILRTNEYFGQYGKISKLYIRDRSPLSSSAVHTLSDDPASHGIYIVYVRREDAARAISSLDGIPAPSGAPGTTLKASYGTTRYVIVLDVIIYMNGEGIVIAFQRMITKLRTSLL
jgi:CCR4-NOT transcription complex subunit 4